MCGLYYQSIVCWFATCRVALYCEQYLPGCFQSCMLFLLGLFLLGLFLLVFDVNKIVIVMKSINQFNTSIDSISAQTKPLIELYLKTSLLFVGEGSAIVDGFYHNLARKLRRLQLDNPKTCIILTSIWSGSDLQGSLGLG